MRWCLYASILGTLVSGILLGSNDENKTGLQLGRARQLSSTRSFLPGHYEHQPKSFTCGEGLTVREGQSNIKHCETAVQNGCADDGFVESEACMDAIVAAYDTPEYSNTAPIQKVIQREVQTGTCCVSCGGSEHDKGVCTAKVAELERKAGGAQYFGVGNGVAQVGAHGLPIATNNDDCAQLQRQLGPHAIVESDSTVAIPAGETAVPPTIEDLRNLDWIDGVRDQEYLPIAPAGLNITIYVLDTGVNCWHRELTGRCVKVYDVFYARREAHRNCRSDSKRCAHDKNGHGSHVAATAAGLSTGVAPRASIAAIKVLTDSGIGSNAGVLAGMDHAVFNCQRVKGASPGCVMTMSLVGTGRSLIYERAVDVALSHDVLTVVAAGNDNRNACNYSPAFAGHAITVASADDTGSGTRVTKSSFSNSGPCVNIWAIGSDVVSARHLTKETYVSKSGTSMATPAVAGGAALVLSAGNVLVSDMGDVLAFVALPNVVLQCPRDTDNLLLRLTPGR